MNIPNIMRAKRLAAIREAARAMIRGDLAAKETHLSEACYWGRLLVAAGEDLEGIR